MADFKPFLFAALNNHEDAQVRMAAIGVVSDLCRTFEGKLFPIMEELVKTLFSILGVRLF
jgi:hypothetical protein